MDGWKNRETDRCMDESIDTQNVLWELNRLEWRWTFSWLKTKHLHIIHRMRVIAITIPTYWTYWWIHHERTTDILSSNGHVPTISVDTGLERQLACNGITPRLWSYRKTWRNVTHPSDVSTSRCRGSLVLATADRNRRLPLCWRAPSCRQKYRKTWRNVTRAPIPPTCLPHGVAAACFVLATADKKAETHNHLSIHQWVRSAIFAPQQHASPIGFLFLKLPPPPCAVLLVWKWLLYGWWWLIMIWLVRTTYPSEKSWSESQLGWWYSIPIYEMENNPNVWNHQEVFLFVSTILHP